MAEWAPPILAGMSERQPAPAGANADRWVGLQRIVRDAFVRRSRSMTKDLIEQLFRRPTRIGRLMLPPVGLVVLAMIGATLLLVVGTTGWGTPSDEHA